MKIVVAYSGGLDTSVLLKWLKEKYNAEIIAYCADVGQAEELDGLEAKALATGASKCFIGDLKEDFATNYIFPMMQANALYEGRIWPFGKARTPSPTAPPARGTTRSALNWPSMPWPRISRSSPRGVIPNSASSSRAARK